MNYFEFYDLPIQFYLDEADLKKKFYAKSKAYHPDFHTLADEATQEHALEMSSLNTIAYKTLADFDSRSQYILQLKGMMAEEGQEKMPNDFLMDIMELNELIMELEFDFDESQLEKAKKTIQNLENEAFANVKSILESYNHSNTSEEDLQKIKIFQLKKRYFLRIQKTLSTFAPH